MSSKCNHLACSKQNKWVKNLSRIVLPYHHEMHATIVDQFYRRATEWIHLAIVASGLEATGSEPPPAHQTMHKTTCNPAHALFERTTWNRGLELAFQRVPGVVGTSVGYTQGEVEKPTYGEVCSGATGHTEAVQVRAWLGGRGCGAEDCGGDRCRRRVGFVVGCGGVNVL